MRTFSSAAKTNLIISVLRSWLMARPSAAPSSWHAELQKILTASLATSFQQTCQSHQRCYFLASEIKGVDPCLQLAERKGVGGTLLLGCKTDAFLSGPRGKHVSGITLLTEETFFLLKYSSLKRLEALREFWKLKILRKHKIWRRIFSPPNTKGLREDKSESDYLSHRNDTILTCNP